MKNNHPVSIFSEIHSSKEKDYVIRLTAGRKLLYHNKWTYATELRNRRKGKVKVPLIYKGKKHEAYLSHVKVQITAINALNFYITSCMAFLLLSAGKRHLWHTLVCKARRQALVQGKTSCMPSTLP